MTTITEVVARDVRFPTSENLAGSDAMNQSPDYSAAYAVLKTDTDLEGHGLTFTIGRGNESRQFPEHYERFAEQQGAEFFDASRVIVSSDVGGIHLDPDEHRKLGEAVAERIRQILG